ncbi:MAG: hypothetical protein J0J01_20650 [Reyranella sp.]|uniref:hypothetical protein n=1 Tax=Reyranella sp. TaxID=1929291 RepID=UPI001AC777D2|nr:hypothetical protein [Reyranella sp.]MBN9089325.1 hypothetical protein [Reyranella sp.]
MNDDRLHKLAERGIEEFRRFAVMFVYLWVVFGLFVLNETVVLGQRHIGFTAQGFALINAAVLAKVMLIAEDLKLGRAFDHLPLIVPVSYKSGLLAAVFIAFHALEEVLLGAFAGKTIADSLPHIGGGTWQGVVIVWAIMSISLLPFFALREIGRLLDGGRLWNMMFRRSVNGSRATVEPS